MKRLKLSSQCQCCQSPHRKEIDRALIRGVTKTSLSHKYGVSVQSLSNHEKNHITRQLAQAVAQGQMSESTDLLQELEDLLRKAKQVLHIAEADEKWYLVLESIKGARGVIELMGKLVIALHEVRRLELEAERERSGEAQQDRSDEFWQKFKILNNEEMTMFYRLADKVRTQSKEVIIEDHTETFPKYKHQDPEPPEEEQEQEEEGEEEEELRVRPVTPRTIPG